MQGRWLRVVVPVLAFLALPPAAHADETKGPVLVGVGAGVFAVGYGGSLLLSHDGDFTEPRMAIPVVGPAFGLKHYVAEEGSFNGLFLLSASGVAQVAGLVTLGFGVHRMTNAPRVVVAPNARGVAIAGEF